MGRRLQGRILEPLLASEVAVEPNRLKSLLSLATKPTLIPAYDVLATSYYVQNAYETSECDARRGCYNVRTADGSYVSISPVLRQYVTGDGKMGCRTRQHSPAK